MRSRRDLETERETARSRAEAAQKAAQPDSTVRCQLRYPDGPLYAVERGWREYGFYCWERLPDGVKPMTSASPPGR